MYLDFYGLSERPFELTPNPKFLFLTPSHREALSNLGYGLSTAKAVTVLIGEAGTGKTTLLRAALESEACQRTRCVYLSNPALTRDEFVETLARGFGLSPPSRTSKASLLNELEAYLRQRRQQGEVTALVVDEAQRLSDELLEEIRLLANIETPTDKLLPLVIAGQPELADRLNQPGHRQLKQRVALRCAIAPFSLSETAAYIATRIATANGKAARLFTREAVALIHDRARGIPRTISVICDNALVTGFAAGRQPVGRDVVLEVCRDFDLREPEEPSVFSIAPTVVSASPSEIVSPGEEESREPVIRVGESTNDYVETPEGAGRFSLFRVGRRWAASSGGQ